MARSRDDELASEGRLANGSLIAGRYRLESRLGAGAMGEVWAATHVITRRRVAMKFLKGAFASGSDMHQRFFREARAASLVHHPNVVEVLDVFELADGMPVMVMEHLLGETLGARLARERVLSVEQVVALLLPAIDAVATAHELGIIHRDLKPDNIFLEAHPAGHVTVKVLDFGIAKLTAQEGDAAASGALTESGSLLGTPWYMAPEQLYGESDIDARVDIWGMGVILYECLSGRRPVEGSNMGQMVMRLVRDGITPIEAHLPELPPTLAQLIGRMLARAREDRPRTLAEVRASLVGFSSPSSAPPSPLLSSKPPLSDQEALELALGKTEAAAASWDTSVSHALARSPAAARRARLGLGLSVTAAVVVLGAVAWRVAFPSAALSSAVASASAPGAAAAPPALPGLLAPVSQPAATASAPIAPITSEPAAPQAPSVLSSTRAPTPDRPPARPQSAAPQRAAAPGGAPSATTPQPAARKPNPGGLAETVPF